MKRYQSRVKIAFKDALEAKPLLVVGDAAIAANTIAGGKFVPLLIVDASERPEIQELIRVHEHLPPGDVESQWVSLPGREGSIILMLEFQRPMEIRFLIDFDIVRQGALVDLVVNAQGFYLQTGRVGDRYITTPDSARILVEVPHTGFEKVWDQILEEHIRKDMRKRNGLGRGAAKLAAREFIASWRKIARTRVPQA